MKQITDFFTEEITFLIVLYVLANKKMQFVLNIKSLFTFNIYKHIVSNIIPELKI